MPQLDSIRFAMVVVSAFILGFIVCYGISTDSDFSTSLLQSSKIIVVAQADRHSKLAESVSTVDLLLIETTSRIATDTAADVATDDATEDATDDTTTKKTDNNTENAALSSCKLNRHPVASVVDHNRRIFGFKAADAALALYLLEHSEPLNVGKDHGRAASTIRFSGKIHLAAANSTNFESCTDLTEVSYDDP